ncbi:unnamed protein product [Absidia cylindrospora]
MSNKDQDQLYLEAIEASASATGVLPEEYLQIYPINEQDLTASGPLSLLDHLRRLTNLFVKTDDTFDPTRTATTSNHSQNTLSTTPASV